MSTEIDPTPPFDSPVWALLLQQLERASPGDVAAWRAAEAAEFAAMTGMSRGLPDRPLVERLIAGLRTIIDSDDKYAAPRAYSMLRGHVLRAQLLGRGDLLPAEAKGRILLTEPRSVTDAELASLLAGYRETRPDDYAHWRGTSIAVAKYRLLNDDDAPLTSALDDRLGRSIGPLAAYIEARCWVQNGIAFTMGRSLLDKLLMAGITAEELALTPEDEALRAGLPSDEDVLAYLEGFDFAPQVHSFTVTVRNANELRALLDLTNEIMRTERKANWDARATARSSDAGHHAARFRIVRELNLAVRAAREQA